MNISSSLVTPPTAGQASHEPSPAPGVLSQNESLLPQTTPLFGPSMHERTDVLQLAIGLEFIFTSGLPGPEPLSYKEQIRKRRLVVFPS